MHYVPQKELKKYREKNKPRICPLLDYETKDWVVDHCHSGGTIRGVVSSEGNAFLGRIENAHKRLSKKASQASLATVLRNMADYLDQPCTGMLHPEGFRQLYKRFYSLPKDYQLDILLKFGTNRDDISKCKNAKQRTDLYKKILKGKYD